MKLIRCAVQSVIVVIPKRDVSGPAIDVYDRLFMFKAIEGIKENRKGNMIFFSISILRL